MQISSYISIFAYGTSEGAEKAWDTRGRGSHTPERDSQIAATEKTLQSSPIIGSSTLGGGVTNTKLVTLGDGTKGVFKESSWGGDKTNETAAWEVAKIVGMDDLVAPVVSRTVDGEEGSVSQFQDGQVAKKVMGTAFPVYGADQKDIAYDGAKNAARAAAFDFVIGNTDRHAGNWLVNPGTEGTPPEQQQLHLIDHGLSFGDAPLVGAGFEKGFIGRMRSQEDSAVPVPSPRSLSWPYEKNRTAILSKLRSMGMSESKVKAVSSRIWQLVGAKTWNGLYGANTKGGKAG